MSTTGTKCRKGTSTIMGTLIFVGIIFTAFIPMMLVMRQADTIYEMRKHELGILDQDRMDEEVYVYIFPSDAPPILTLSVQNRGTLIVNVMQVWINDVPYQIDDFNVQPTSLLEMDLTDFTPELDNWYLIKIITDRGNVFSSESGSLYYDSGGNWLGGMFAINFFISYPAAGWFDVEIRYDNAEGFILTDPPFQIHKSSSGPAFDFFEVPTSDTTYYVKITKNSELIYEDLITINWPNGSPIEWVFA